jgi:hypothetical protein
MIHHCENCLGENALREYLDKMFADSLEEISFQQWQGTDRAMLCTQTTTAQEFVELLVNAISKLTVHSFIAKSQARYLKNLKDNLSETSCIALPCLTLLRITSLWSRMKSKDFIGTKSVVPYTQLPYTT